MEAVVVRDPTVAGLVDPIDVRIVERERVCALSGGQDLRRRQLVGASTGGRRVLADQRHGMRRAIRRERLGGDGRGAADGDRLLDVKGVRGEERVEVVEDAILVQETPRRRCIAASHPPHGGSSIRRGGQALDRVVLGVEAQIPGRAVLPA